MDKKSKILIAVFLILILISVGITYWRIMVKRDYVIESQIDCDPYAEECFTWECDPESDAEGEACTGDPEMDVWYYKLARRNAANIPLCDPEKDETCDPWTCPEGEKDCEQILCDETTAEEQGAECNDPEIYTLENPVKEECDSEEDEECDMIEDSEASDEEIFGNEAEGTEEE